MARPKPTTISHARTGGHERGIKPPVTGEKCTRCVAVLGRSDEVVVSGTTDSRIAQIAGCQRGRIARRQIIQAAISDGALRRRVVNGTLFRVLHGVFAAGHPGPVELGAETAALLAAGEGSALSGLSAAYLWGLLDPGDAIDEVIDVIAPTQRRMTAPGIRVHRCRSFTAAEVRVHRGLPVLSPARALLDVAEQTTARRIELALDRGRVTRLLTTHEVAGVISRFSNRHGAAVLSGLLDDGPTTVTRSEAEERVLDLVRSAELPVPAVNVRLHGFEVDFYWPAVGLVLEVDGFRFHASRRAFEHDRRKDATLQAAGIRTMRTTWRQVNVEPTAVIARVAMAMVRQPDYG